MKRDMELIREILLKIETNCNDVSFYSVPFDEFKKDREDVIGHCKLIIDRGLAEGKIVGTNVLISGLTWDGHDFVDNSRDSKVWKAALKAAGTFSFGIFTKVLVEVATRYAMGQIPQLY